MCEWLSRGEWCDVKLLCGRRSFSAHRAVLASVSTFLRRILLTCSSDEAVTYILLPDFDLEAMASVLYYIYNGEVNLQKGNLRPFLDIIQIMQIHIDGQYLPEIQEFYSIEKYFEVEKHCATSILHSNIFTLGFKEGADQHIFCIKKCKEMQRALLKYSHSDVDIHDNVVRRQNESKVDESRLGNLKSPHEDRQRNSLLRDLFIETYPRNGNVNGLTESVLAISNECYHSPASVLLANANCRHLSIEGTQTRPSKNATGHPPTSSDVLGEDVFREAWNKGINHLPNSQLYNYSGNESLVYGNTDVYFNFNNYIYTGGNRSHNKYEVPESFDINKIVLDTEVHKNSQSSGDLILDNLISKNQSVRKNSSKKFKYNRSPKPIFNHVLESPWNARKPNNYRPFRRKEQKEIQSHSIQVGPNVTGNDTNNNIQISIQTSDENKTKLTLGDQELIDTTTIIANEESFKCSHCDQMFTSGEALVVHMIRHSTNARYTCGECGKTFSQLRNFKYHMSIHRGTREFAATCTVCGKYFNDRGYLSSHMKIHRNRKEYKCTLCPKSFNQRVAYNMHVRIHTGVKPHVCDECGKAFSRKMLLKQHQRTHSGERPYACPHCDKRFADRSNMTLHLRLHTGVKPFSCPMCPKSFTKKHHLKSHLNFHTGSKPYSCPRCSLAFTQSSNMRTHYKKCTAPGPSTSNDCINSLVTPS